MLLCLLPLAACNRSETSASEPTTATIEHTGEVDLPMPSKADVSQGEASWPDESSFDPLWIQNIDVTDPKRREYVVDLRSLPEWAAISLLEGISLTEQQIPVLDAEGNPVLTEDGDPLTYTGLVTEYWFKGHDRPYRAGEEVENTGFVIPEGWHPKYTDTRPRHNPNLPRGYMPPYGKGD